MVELRRAGIDVPGQVSLVGYDDIQMAALPHVDLTTVGQDVHPPYLAVRATTSTPSTQGHCVLG